MKDMKDAVRCFDCSEISLIECGGEVCPKCKNKNLLWLDSDESEMEEERFAIKIKELKGEIKTNEENTNRRKRV